MPGFIARLYRKFRSDTYVSNDAPTKNNGQLPFVGDGSDGMWHSYQDYLSVDTKRASLYKTYEQMDTYDLIASILDMYSEDATPVDPNMKRALWVTSQDRDLEHECNRFLDTIGYDEDISTLARDLAKMGDVFDRLVYAASVGVRAAHNVNPRLVYRKEDKIRQLMGFKQDGKKFRRGTDSLSYPWDYVHYRLRGRDRDSLYGSSMLYPLIRPLRQLALAEDYSLLYQICRHPDRYMFLVDVGSHDDVSGQSVLRRFKESMKYTLGRDSKTGYFDHRYNALTPMEDIFLGIREGSSTRVEKLSGSANANDVANLMYYVNKLFAVARAPKTIFGYEGTDVYTPKQAISNQDIRYAKNIMRLQKAIKYGARTLVETHLAIQGRYIINEEILEDGYRKGGQYEFDVNMYPVSYLEELQRLEVDQTRWQVVDAMMQSGRDHPAFDSRSWVDYILREYARFSDNVLSKVLVPYKQAKDRESYWYGGVGEMPPDQKAAMKAQSAAQIAQAQQTIDAADQQAQTQSPSPEELAAMSDRELKDLGLNDKDIEKVRSLTKEDRVEYDPNRYMNLTESEKDVIHTLVRTNPRVQEFVAKARDLFEEQGTPYPQRPVPLPSIKLMKEVKNFEDDFIVEDCDIE